MEPYQFITILAVVIIHTGALFYWGGKVSKTLDFHEHRFERDEEEIKLVRSRYHDNVVPILHETKVALTEVKTTMVALQDRMDGYDFDRAKQQ